MEETLADYLDKHLPYRINSLLAPDLIAHRRNSNISNDLRIKCYQDSLVLEPAFEISIVFGRALLQFLGIDYDTNKKDLKKFEPRKSGTDITIQILFPDRNFCSLNDDIVNENRTELCTIIKIANKSVAHLTSVGSNSEEHDQLNKARMAIYKLMLKYVPEIRKENIWWYSQVEKTLAV